MTADIVQIRDYQSRRAIERAHKALEEHEIERDLLLAERAFREKHLANQMFPSVFGFSDGIDGIPYQAPEKDPA